MQLTAFTDLALRMTMRLAVLDEGRSTTSAALAEELRVPPSHAAKVTTALGKLGVVETRRGRTGGLRLARDAHELSVGTIVRALEGSGDVVACEGAVPCPLRAGCRLRTALRQAQEAFYAALDPISVAEVSDGPTRTLLLQLTARPAG
ncbi:RrF2 family transcriptional regulator [Nocardioides insulae]|uniref:RrF2 family transcriptional regulator n=1 Tax=Nocardioides insulae TaxID=394734 RepID=UPI0004045E00|nr:Rrf2 family transcriptional regulator [Nocardioides insulae]